jgi:4-hydroxybenzoate polyprenyltransferase
VPGAGRPAPEGGQEYVAGKRTAPRLRPLIRLLRPYQWLKNTLIFFPFLLAHEGRNPAKWGLALLAFAAFSLAASCGYVVNDILDRAQDRQHPRRRHRPVASGDVPLGWALLLPVPLLAGAALAAAFLPPVCALILVWYLAATSAYSWVLKDRLMADVITLALLYTCRLFMGANATSNVISPWLAAFSLCIFLSLALCKRVSELMTWKSLERDGPPGRKYRSDDIPLLEMMAVSSGFLGCLVAVFYVQSSDILLLYRHPQYLWVVVIALLYWITRLIIYTHRGKCPDDPIFFVLQDRTTLLVLTLAAGVVFLAV